MGIYLLKSSAILIIFWLLYVFVLEKENIHRFKRFYLITSIILSFLIPFLSFTQYVYLEPVETLNFSNNTIPFTHFNQPIESLKTPFWTLERILWSVYSFGVLLFGFRFTKNLFGIVKTINTNEKQRQTSITFVLLKSLINPHTFFNYIFLNKHKFQKNEVPKEVLLHEEVHAKQKHSLDILLIELLQIIFWFQPIIWLFKNRIKLNHEFLADQAVINAGYKPATYKNILLNYSSNHNYSIANAIDYSSIKKRFTVMNTQTSKTKSWLLGVLIIPIIGILMYSFSTKTIVEIEDTKLAALNQNTTQTTNNHGASDKAMQEYKTFIKAYNSTKTIFADKYERAVIIYNTLMSDAQRASVEKYPEPFVKTPNLTNVTPKKLTKSLFEDFKDSKKYAIWLDNRVIKNSELKNYNHNDFIHYSGSFVHKNARSKKFPQPNQYHLYTKDGFKNTFLNAEIKKYKTVLEAYTSLLSKHLKSPLPNTEELLILKAKADKIFDTFSDKEIKTHNIKKPSKLQNNQSASTNSKQQNTPTAKEIVEYNTWAKKINNNLNKIKTNKTIVYPIIKLKDLDLYKSIYNRMTDKQKANAEVFPNTNIIPPPPPKPIKPNLTPTSPPAPLLPPTPRKTKNGKDKLNTEDCLKINSKLNVEKGETLKIECLENYPENKLVIYNRWGNIIYSKENYNNNWDGKVAKEFGSKNSDKAPTGTYYYALSSPKLKKPKVGWLYINSEEKSEKKDLGLEKEFKEKFKVNNNKSIKGKNNFKQRLYIEISEDGNYAIGKTNSITELTSASLTTIDNLISKLSKEDIINTFVFSSSNDLKKFRGKPSNHPEYQNDIEIILIKDKYIEINRIGDKDNNRLAYQSVLDNDPSKSLKSHVNKLGEIFKKYGVTNITF